MTFGPRQARGTHSLILVMASKCQPMASSPYDQLSRKTPETFARQSWRRYLDISLPIRSPVTSIWQRGCSVGGLGGSVSDTMISSALSSSLIPSQTLAETLPDVQRLFDQMMNLDPSRRPTSRTCLGKIQWIMAATASEVQHAALPPRFSGWDRPKRDFDDVAPNSITEWKSLKLEDPTRSPWEIFRLALDEHQCTLFDLDPRDKRWKVVRGPPTPLVTGGARSYKVDRAYISVLTPKVRK